MKSIKEAVKKKRSRIDNDCTENKKRKIISNRLRSEKFTIQALQLCLRYSDSGPGVSNLFSNYKTN